ncbi:MSHA biogenesis protein MshA [Vibrio breoganii]|uniref:type II secretion system protein n=1 Tax=Vibrio breoganii TaxID=553239 RepID=UPI000C834D98|nr:type II secretion system protein [Vibrio breoganii]PMM08476.1 MSHA biogenesis protein MshA [Vibrio breoganii]
MHKQGGFTLIELVVVIVILGILSVTAAPRFLNLQSDARVSALQGMKGAMAGAGSIVYGKAAINGVDRAESSSVSNIALVYGYPEASAQGIVRAVQGLDDAAEWRYSDEEGVIYVTFANRDEPDGSQCSVIYEDAEQNATPRITVVKTGC